MRDRLSLRGLVFLVLGLLFVAAPATAGAAVESCVYNPSTKAVTATITTGGSATVKVNASGQLLFGQVPVACGARHEHQHGLRLGRRILRVERGSHAGHVRGLLRARLHLRVQHPGDRARDGARRPHRHARHHRLQRQRPDRRRPERRRDRLRRRPRHHPLAGTARDRGARPRRRRLPQHARAGRRGPRLSRPGAGLRRGGERRARSPATSPTSSTAETATTSFSCTS